MVPGSRPAVHVPAQGAWRVLSPCGDAVSSVVPATLTGGSYATVQVDVHDGANWPAYVDHAADQAVHVLAGRFTVEVGSQTYADLGPGSMVYVPRGARRRIAAGAGGGRLLVTATPGESLEDAVAELGRLVADQPVVPSAAFARCGIEIVAAPAPSVPSVPSQQIRRQQ